MPSRFCVIALALAVAGTAAAQSLPAHSTWKLNTAKSQYTSPMPKNVTLVVDSVPGGIRVDVKGTAADGSAMAFNYTQTADGKEYPIKGSPDYDAATSKRIDDATTEVVRKKGGKVMQTLRVTLSKDGRTFSVKTTGTNAKGEKLNNTAIYDKQ
ncbi:MAG: hypothetical protein ACHQQ3_01040 [Gemmatimonadales bacterium]